MTATHADDARLRIDKWLWVARFFKTRSAAALAVESGKVRLNAERVKPAKAVRAGDRVDIRSGDVDWVITVQAIAERRGPADVARTLYVEDEVHRDKRIAIETRRRFGFDPRPEHGGRPEKRARRELTRVRGY